MVDVDAPEKLVDMLRVLQSETRRLQEADRKQDVEIGIFKSELASKQARLREQEEKIDSLRYLLDSAIEHQRRELIQAETGRREWFREDPEDPGCVVVVSKAGEVYQL